MMEYVDKDSTAILLFAAVKYFDFVSSFHDSCYQTFNSQDFAIFVGNIPPETTESDMRSAFQSCGVITRVQLPRDHTGKVKGTDFTRISVFSHGQQTLLQLLRADRGMF